MDPNANLAEQRRMAKCIIRQMDDRDPPGDIAGNALRLAELVQALDHWISMGGILPEKWLTNLNTKDRR